MPPSPDDAALAPSPPAGPPPHEGRAAAPEREGRVPGRSPWWHSLKLRIVAGALAALFLGMALTTWHMGRVAETQLLELEAARSHDEVQRLAAVVGHRVAELQRALRLAASQLRRDQMVRPEQLMAHFRDHAVLRGMFAGIGVSDPEGQLRFIVEASGAKTTAVSIADREYFQRLIETQRPTISQPLVNRVTREPVVVFSQPLVDSQGLWGVLSGTMLLNGRDLIDDLAETRNNSDSTLIVIADDRGLILAHPQSARILQGLGDEPRLAQPAQQWQEDGRPLLRDAGRWTSATDVVAMAGETGTGWHVWRATSQRELLAPLRAARADALAVAVAFGLTMALLLLFFLVEQLRPLARLRSRAEALMRDDGEAVGKGEWPAARGEVGALIRTLRHLWTERAAAERRNAQALNKLASVMAASPVGLAFSRHQRFEVVSDECCRLLACREADLVGNPMAMIFDAAADYPKLRTLSHEAFSAGRAYEGEWKLRTAHGRVFWARIRARPVVEGDHESGSIWSLYDIDEQVAARETLQHEVRHDALTGVLSRKGFERVLAEAWAAASPAQPASLVMIDLDHFKPVNDRGGHAAGDAMLKAVAESIARQVRGTDAVARLGGDEFAVLLPGCGEAHAREIVAKIHQGVREIALPWQGEVFRIGASLGVAEWLAPYGSAREWLAAADAACYEAKAAGRDAVRSADARPPMRLVRG